MCIWNQSASEMSLLGATIDKLTLDPVMFFLYRVRALLPKGA